MPMTSLRLLDKADLSIYFDAEKIRYGDAWLLQKGITRESFMLFTRDWLSVGFAIDGVEVGGSLFDGKEVHLAVLPEYHGKWSLLVEPWLKWLFKLKEIVDVRIPIENEKCIRFFDRNGFVRIAEDTRSVSFRMSNHPDLFFNRRERAREQRHVPA